MDVNIAALVAGIVAVVGVIAHGGVGGVWLDAQLRAAEVPTTELSKRLFGERDVTWTATHIAWHTCTAYILGSAAALFLTAFGALDSRDLLRFIAILQAAILALGLSYWEKTPSAMLKPIPVVFAVGMTAIGALAWVASDSLG